MSLGLIELLMDYVRENCSNVRELSGKCQGFSTGVVCGNPDLPKDPINNIPALVEVMAWRQGIIWTIDIIDAYMSQSASMS